MRISTINEELDRRQNLNLRRRHCAYGKFNFRAGGTRPTLKQEKQHEAFLNLEMISIVR